MKILEYDSQTVIHFKKNLGCSKKLLLDDLFRQVVEEIIANVRQRGDEAVWEYSAKFDKVALNNTTSVVSANEIKSAYQSVQPEYLASIKQAIERIRRFHEKSMLNMPKDWQEEFEGGIVLGESFRPIERVGVYCPGGIAPLVSTVLMGVIPAKIAGVKEVVLCTPPRIDGSLNPYIIIAADILGVANIYKIGGAQAIAAMALGTATIPRVDKVVGPGNIYVNLAKKILFGEVSIDMIAGPTELLILADNSANPEFIAADLLSQAEHDPLAGVTLITTSHTLADRVQVTINEQRQQFSHREAMDKAIDNGVIIITHNLEEGIELTNLFAPEHLELHINNPWEIFPKINYAGAIFIGEYSSVVVGDYFAGPNHILPTSGTARFSSPLGVMDFLKRSSIIAYNKHRLLADGSTIVTLAEMEGLEAHREAIRRRMVESQ